MAAVIADANRRGAEQYQAITRCYAALSNLLDAVDKVQRFGISEDSPVYDDAIAWEIAALEAR
jgi:hypothetical protein